RKHRVFSDFRDTVAEAVASLKLDLDSPLADELHRIDVLSTLRGDQWVGKAISALEEQELDPDARIVGASVGYPYDEPLPEAAFQGQAVVLESPSVV
ncbi:glycosyltransferase, partial [Priestia megaterium]